MVAEEMRLGTTLGEVEVVSKALLLVGQKMVMRVPVGRERRSKAKRWFL